VDTRPPRTVPLVSSSQAATSSQAESTLPAGSRRPVAVVFAVVFIGLLAASYSLAQFGAAPVLGRISDERGRRPVLMLSVGVAGVAWVIFGFAAEVGAAVGTTLGLVTLFGALGLVGAAFGLGFVFGPAVGGLLASDTAVSIARAVLPGFVPVTPFSLPSFGAAGFSFLALSLLAVSPLAGTAPLVAGVPTWLTGGLAALLVFGALASFGNGAITVGLATLVSEGASDQTQGAAFGVTQGAGSLGRTVGPALAAGAYVAVYWSPFVAGALLLVPVALLLRR